MRSVMIGAVSAGLILAASSTAFAGNDPVSNYLGSCMTSGTSCLDRVTDVVVNGRDSHYICVPKHLSTRDAVQREIDWLEHSANNNPSFAAKDMEDALWTGATHLWPCHQQTAMHRGK